MISAKFGQPASSGPVDLDPDLDAEALGVLADLDERLADLPEASSSGRPPSACRWAGPSPRARRRRGPAGCIPWSPRCSAGPRPGRPTGTRRRCRARPVRPASRRTACGPPPARPPRARPRRRGHASSAARRPRSRAPASASRISSSVQSLAMLYVTVPSRSMGGRSAGVNRGAGPDRPRRRRITIVPRRVPAEGAAAGPRLGTLGFARERCSEALHFSTIIWDGSTTASRAAYMNDFPRSTTIPEAGPAGEPDRDGAAGDAEATADDAVAPGPGPAPDPQAPPDRTSGPSSARSPRSAVPTDLVEQTDPAGPEVRATDVHIDPLGRPPPRPLPDRRPAARRSSSSSSGSARPRPRHQGRLARMNIVEHRTPPGRRRWPSATAAGVTTSASRRCRRPRARRSSCGSSSRWPTASTSTGWASSPSRRALLNQLPGPAVRRPARRRAGRRGQDHDALQLPAAGPQPQPQRHDHRGPGRVPLRRRQPGRDQRPDRPDLRPRASGRSSGRTPTC